MREWNVKTGTRLAPNLTALTLAADARLGSTQYSDDQIWELTLRESEPPALALQTTYGLRARSLRLFPRFTEGDLTQTDPADFPRPPTICKVYPNYILVSFSPLEDIDVEAEYWVPESQGVAGRFLLRNASQIPRQIRLEWAAQLSPTRGERMACSTIQGVPVLTGQTEDLVPVVFLTGSTLPGRGPYPALTQELELAPGEERRVYWSHAALSNAEDSFNMARSIAGRSWEAEIARLELLNASQVEILTGSPDWDVAFALAQKLAFGAFVGPTQHLPALSFVQTRHPDQGYSMRGDGSDYNHLWNGQTPLDSYYLAGLILPGAPHLAQGLLRNFLATQTEDGHVDWKPGLGGQRGRLLATPVLCSLAWRIYQFSDDRDFLEEVFPSLWRFVQAWFSTEQDQDGDGIPEWNHPVQAGFEDHPVFSRWNTWAQGVEIAVAESPALCAFLFRECQCLIEIARVLEHSEPVTALESLAEHLRTALETSWNDAAASYLWWDRDTHYSTPGEKLGERLGPGVIPIERSFDHPVRLMVRIQSSSEATRQAQVFIHGDSASGQPRVEHITNERFKWYLGTGSMTGERVYTRLEQVELLGLEENDLVTVFSVDFSQQDISLLLPLWAGMLDPERAETLVRKTIASTDRYWRASGIPTCPVEASPDPASGDDSTPDQIDFCQSVLLVWNTLIGEGLLAYGYQAEAADLVSRLMTGITLNLKADGSFRRYYRADSGKGFGDRNTVSGLAPVGLFLDVLGVRLISPQKVFLQGFNPFPWPVTVKYRGTTILRHKDSTSVIFMDGQTITIDDPAPRVVSLEKVQA